MTVDRYKVVMGAIVALGGIVAIHSHGDMVFINHIWKGFFGYATKTSQVVQQYHRTIYLLLLKEILGAILFWAGLWGLLNPSPPADDH